MAEAGADKGGTAPASVAVALVETENAQQELSQDTQIVEEQAPAPITPFEALQSRLRDHPHDTIAWQDLINFAEESGDLKLISTAYDSLLKVYPNTVQAQIAYLRHSQRAFPVGKPKAPEQEPISTPQALFSQWLKQSPNVEIWKLYLDYVRANQSSPRDVIKKAYEFALRFVGQDRDAGEIWKDYIDYVKADPTSTEREGQEKMDLLRSVYRRAVQIPLDNLEQIWREWDSFENGLNKVTAKKFLADVSPDYMTARTKKTELAEHYKRIRLYYPVSHAEGASLDLPAPPVMRSEERSLLASWRKYLEFEESNPLEIDEKSMLNARILAIYRKAVIKMRFYPEVWHLAYLWCQSTGKGEDAHNFLKNGLDANPTSFLLNFSYAEHQEHNMLAYQATSGADLKKVEDKKTEVYEIFKRFTSLLKKELDELEEQHIAAGGNQVSQQSPGANAKAPVAVAAPITMEDDVAMKENEIYGIVDPAVAEAKEREREQAKENERVEAVLNDRRTELGQAGIAWLRYAKRTGQSIGLRNAFKEIRADKWVCWQVYEAAALLEHQIAPTADVAAKIFELGLRLFSTDVDYVVRYLNFLTNKSDEANARALFEKTIGLFEPEKARPIWQRWLMYQMNVADLPTLHKLDKRVAEAYPKDRAMKLFAQRYTYLGGEVVAPPNGIDAIASHDLQTQLRAPSVVIPALLMASPTPLVPQHHSPPTQSSNGASQSYSHSYSHSQGAPGHPAAASTSLPRVPPPRVHSPLPPSKRPLPEQEALGSQKRARRSPPPARRAPVPPPRRWGSPPPRDDRRRERGRSPERVSVPPSVLWFMSHLPNATAYDGPLFRTDEYLNMLSKAAIPPPSSSRIRSRSPPSRSRPGPDYGPYQGPASRPPRRY